MLTKDHLISEEATKKAMKGSWIAWTASLSVILQGLDNNLLQDAETATGHASYRHGRLPENEEMPQLHL